MGTGRARVHKRVNHPPKIAFGVGKGLNELDHPEGANEPSPAGALGKA